MMSLTPTNNLPKLIERTLVPYAPFSLPKIHLFDDISGTMANDFAMKAALIKHHSNVTGKDVTMNNLGEHMFQ